MWVRVYVCACVCVCAFVCVCVLNAEFFLYLPMNLESFRAGTETCRVSNARKAPNTSKRPESTTNTGGV